MAPEFKAEFIGIFKEAANFFKHADRKPNASTTVEFSPFLTQIFFLYAIVGLAGLGETLSDTENAYRLWFAIHHPELTHPDFTKHMADSIPVKHIDFARRLKKREFLQAMLEAAALTRAGG